MNSLKVFGNNIYKKENILVTLIFFLSLLSRSIMAFFFSDRSLENEWLILVQNLYFHNTLSLINFDDLFLPNLWMPPIYAYYIYLHTFFFGIEGKLVNSVIVTQIFLSSFTAVLFLKILGIMFERKIAFYGALIFCLFPLIVYSSSQISSVSIYLFLFTLFILMVIKVLNQNKINEIILGIISGLLVLTSRDFILIFVVSMLFLLFFKFLRLKSFIIISLVFLLTLSPYIIRNYNSFDKLIIHSGLGYNLWKAYNPLSKVEAHQNSNPKAITGAYTDESELLQSKLEKIEKNIYFRINEDKVYLNQAKNYIVGDPLKYFKLYVNRLVSFYFIDFNSTQKNYYNFFHIGPNLIVSFLSIFGLIFYNKKNYKLNYFALIMILLVLVYASFAILPRYKLYVLPMQIIFSLHFVNFIYGKLIKKN